MTSIHDFFRRPHPIRNQAAGNRRDDPLPRLLAQIVERVGQPGTIERATSRPWASALFEGRHHTIRLRIAGTDAIVRRIRFMAGLEDAEWTLAGHFVADITVDSYGMDSKGEWIELSALTIRDW